MEIDDRTQDPEAPASRVLDWFMSEDRRGFSAEACAVARRRLAASGFPASAELVEDVVGDAVANVTRRLRSPTPLLVDNPAAYGSVVIRHVVSGMSRGVEVPVEQVPEPEGPEHPPPHDPSTDRALVDELRLAVERVGGPAWLVSATLAYMIFEMHPDAVPAGAPSPRAGATPAQALAWPALWFAGRRDCFPRGGGDPRRRTRARYVARVLENRERVYEQYRAEQERTDG